MPETASFLLPGRGISSGVGRKQLVSALCIDCGRVFNGRLELCLYGLRVRCGTKQGVCLIHKGLFRYMGVNMNIVRKNVLGQFCVMFVPVALLVIGVVVSFYHGEVREEVNQKTFEGQRLAERHEGQIRQAFQSMIADIKTLSEHTRLRAFLDNPSEQNRKLLGDDFLSFYAYRGMYDNVRVLDDHGKEIVRVDSRGGKPAVVTDALLRDKGDRYYFTDTMRLGSGSVYVSPFDLTIEESKVRKPFMPTIRVAEPLFDSAGNKKGILVLNYRGQDLLARMDRDAWAADSGLSILLLNRQGYWLKGLDRGDEWGFMFKSEMRTFGRMFPEAWARMMVESSGTLLNDEGLFSFRTIYPLQADSGMPGEAMDVARPGSGRPGRDDYFWHLVVYVPADQLGANASEHLDRLMPYLLAMMVLFAAFTFSLAWVNVKKARCEDSVDHLEHYDILTELPNRRLLYDRLKQLMAQEERYKRIFAVLFINLNGFNFVNDRYGRDAGDEVLRQVASRILGDIRKVDTASRIGGDEYVVALTELNDPEGPSIVADKIIASLSKPFVVRGHEQAVVGASVGICIYPADGMDIDTLITHANEAMYQAKTEGTNAYRFFSPSSVEQIPDEKLSGPRGSVDSGN